MNICTFHIHAHTYIVYHSWRIQTLAAADVFWQEVVRRNLKCCLSSWPVIYCSCTHDSAFGLGNWLTGLSDHWLTLASALYPQLSHAHAGDQIPFAVDKCIQQNSIAKLDSSIPCPDSTSSSNWSFACTFSIKYIIMYICIYIENNIIYEYKTKNINIHMHINMFISVFI